LPASRYFFRCGPVEVVEVVAVVLTGRFGDHSQNALVETQPPARAR